MQTGYKGHAIPWSGSFIDVVARTSDVVLPSCVYTPSGLGEFMHSRRTVATPEPGDIVFYVFPTTDQFSMPHCGIVSNVDDFVQTGEFLAIEAQVTSGLPRGSQSADGIYERRRWRYDVLAFARPNFAAAAKNKHRPGMETENADGLPFVRLSRVRPGKKGSDVQTVQVALEIVAGLTREEYTYGLFDDATQRAYSRWQRQIGYVHPDSTGVPDPGSLRTLGARAKMFRVEESEN